MKISFEYLGEPITPQQAELQGEYERIFTEPSGLIKKIESYRDDEIKRIGYYLSADETEEEVTALLFPLNCGLRIISRETYGSYRIESTNHFLKGQLVGKSRNLYDSNNKSVCFQELDINTEQPILEETAKYLGVYKDETSSHYAKCHYNADGSLYYCEYNYFHDYDSDELTAEEIKTRFVLSDEMHNYYLTAEFYPPL